MELSAVERYTTEVTTFIKSSPVFTIPPIQPPLRLMLAETPSPHGSGASRVTVGTMSAGSVLIVPNCYMSPTFLKLLKRGHENASQGKLANPSPVSMCA